MTQQLDPRTLELLQAIATDRKFRASVSTLSYDVIERVAEWLQENRDVFGEHGADHSTDQGNYVFALLMGWLIGLGGERDLPGLLQAVEIGAQSAQAVAVEIRQKRRH